MAVVLPTPRKPVIRLVVVCVKYFVVIDIKRAIR
jgi:hypothetical protein